jgi:hypothetical protein
MMLFPPFKNLFRLFRILLGPHVRRAGFDSGDYSTGNRG